jgi:hypothetical protein
MMRISIPDQLLHHSKELNTQWCIITIITIIIIIIIIIIITT